MQSVPADSSQGAARGAGGCSMAASALERAGKRPPAVLRLWVRAKAIPGEARLAVNRFLTRCIRNSYLERALGRERHAANQIDAVIVANDGSR